MANQLNPLYGTWNFNGSAIENLDDAVNLLKGNEENCVARAMEVFSRVHKDTRSGVYEMLFHKIHFDNVYWGCGEDAFHDQKGLKSTPEQKAQAIESYLSQVAAARFYHNEQSVNPKAVHFLFRRTAELLKSGDVQKAMDLFARMPKEQREGVYGELYHLINFSRNYWGCAEDAFHDRNEQHSTPHLKGVVITNFLLRNIADLLKRGEGSIAQDLFSRLPREQRDGVALHNSTSEGMAQAIENYLLQVQKEELNEKKEPAALPVQPQDYRQQLKEQAAMLKAMHLQTLEASCPTSKKNYYDEPKLERGQCVIRRSMAYTAVEQCYILTIRKPDSYKNEHILIGIDEWSGDLSCRGKIYQSLADLLKGFSVKVIDPHAAPARVIPVAQPPVIPAREPAIETLPKLKATEPLLSNEEVLQERLEAESLLSVGTRSMASESFIKHLSNYKNGGLEINGEMHFPVTGGTQDFSTLNLVSCGSSPREILVLNPSQSTELAKHFTRFRQMLHAGMTTFEVLIALKDYVRKEIFPSCLYDTMSLVDAVILPSGALDADLESTVDRMIDEARKTHPTATNAKHGSTLIPIMSIDDFVKSKFGVCRHHALVAAYLLDRLLTEEHPLIGGTVQHIRGNLDGPLKGGHAWVTFIPKQKGTALPEKWHLDTLWGKLFNFAEDQTELRSLYGNTMIDDQVKRTKFAAKKNGQLLSN